MKAYWQDTWELRNPVIGSLPIFIGQAYSEISDVVNHVTFAKEQSTKGV